MHTAETIRIRAPKMRVFETASDLARWPEILPHYRYIRFLEKHPGRAIVKMAANRDFIPISWVSEVTSDPSIPEIRFTHLRAWTKGMKVVWKFSDTPDGCRIDLIHDLRFRFPPLAPVAEWIIGDFFIQNIAGKTLRRMKEFHEQ